MAPEYECSRAAYDVWEAKSAGLKAELKRLAGKAATGNGDAQSQSADIEQQLNELSMNRPIIKPLPDLFYGSGDDTPEAVAHDLGTGWPSAGIIADEGGTVIGSRSMNSEAATGYMAMMNKLWDGSEYRQRRKSVKGVAIRGRRVTVSIMVQQSIMEQLLDKGSQGIGFIARFLFCEAESTIGSREITDEPPEDRATTPSSENKALDRFNERITRILDYPLPVNDLGELEPPMLRLSREAWIIWRDFFNDVEKELAPFGELESVKDIASKSAENATRIATLLQIFDRGFNEADQIEGDYMQRGCVIAGWYLSEARSYFSQMETPQDRKDAALLSRWLTEEASRKQRNGQPIMNSAGEVELVNILWGGPNSLRTAEKRDAALKILADPEVDHLRLFKKGRQKWLIINPNLLNSMTKIKNRNQSQRGCDSLEGVSHVAAQ